MPEDITIDQEAPKVPMDELPVTSDKQDLTGLASCFQPRLTTETHSKSPGSYPGH